MNNEKRNKKQDQKKPVLLYALIIVLSCALVIMGYMTSQSLKKLASIQAQVGDLEQIVTDVSQLSSSADTEADPLREFQEQDSQSFNKSDISVYGESLGPFLPPAQEGVSANDQNMTFEGSSSSENQTMQQNLTQEGDSSQSGQNPANQQGTSSQNQQNPADQQGASSQNQQNPADQQGASSQNQQNPANQQGDSSQSGQNPTGQQDASSQSGQNPAASQQESAGPQLPGNSSENASSQESSDAENPQDDQLSEEELLLEGEGTISPSKESEDTVDEQMDSLIKQVEVLLPGDNGSWSLYVCNLRKDSEGVLNEGPMQAASLIKLYIMGAVYENYDSLIQEHGQDQVDGQLLPMITVSDNDAANTLVNWLGGGSDQAGMDVVNSFCKEHGYTNTSMGRMLLQSNENGENYTSVTDCGRFLREVYQINNGTAENAALSHADSMYYLLKLQERRNKIPAQLPEGVQTANKTGELDTVENDAGIIYDTAKDIDLVVCFMSENLRDTSAAQTCIAENSRRIYGYYNE